MEAFVTKYFKFGHSILAHPYHLQGNPIFGYVTLSMKKTKAHYLWILVVLLFFIYFVANIALLAVSFQNYMEKHKFVHMTFHMMWIICTVAQLAHHLPNFIASESVMQLMNGSTGLAANLEKYHFRSDCVSKSLKYGTKVIYAISMYSIASMFPVFVPIFYIFTEEPFQFGYLAYAAFKPINIVLATVTGILVNMWYSFLLWISYVLLLYVNLAFMLVFKSAVMEIIKSPGMRSLSQMYESMLIYSKLRILTTIYNNVYGLIYVPPIKGVFTFNTILSALLTVRLASDGDTAVKVFGVVMGSWLLLAFAMFLSFVAEIHEYSSRLQKYLTFQQKQGGKLGRRLLRSYKLEAITSGGMYEMKKFTCVTVLGMLSNLAASALMSVKI